MKLELAVLAQPPCDDAHVAPGCELFSDPTKTKPGPVPLSYNTVRDILDNCFYAEGDGTFIGKFKEASERILALTLAPSMPLTKEWTEKAIRDFNRSELKSAVPADVAATLTLSEAKERYHRITRVPGITAALALNDYACDLELVVGNLQRELAAAKAAGQAVAEQLVELQNEWMKVRQPSAPGASAAVREKAEKIVIELLEYDNMDFNDEERHYHERRVTFVADQLALLAP